jgi:hypothetical protein
MNVLILLISVCFGRTFKFITILRYCVAILELVMESIIERVNDVYTQLLAMSLTTLHANNPD